MSMLRKISWAQAGHCEDCKIVPTVSAHGDKFNDVQICEMHRSFLSGPLKKCDVCGCANNSEYGDTCRSCCEHGDIDEGHCLECGGDFTEELMAAAYARAKDARKYGA